MIQVNPSDKSLFSGDILLSFLPWLCGAAAAAHVGATDRGSSQRAGPLGVSGSRSTLFRGPPCICGGSPRNCLSPAGGGAETEEEEKESSEFKIKSRLVILRSASSFETNFHWFFFIKV